MASKRSRKVKKRQKALQRRQQPTSTQHSVTQIPLEYADQLAMTTTGEIMQLIRLHYEVLDGEQRIRNSKAIVACLPRLVNRVQRLDPPRVGSDESPSAPRGGLGSPASAIGATGSAQADAPVPRPGWRSDHPVTTRG